MLKVSAFDRERAWEFLAEKGLPKDSFWWHCMPQATLDNLSSYLSGVGLQIGGFIGISHCHIATLKTVDLLVTVDLNSFHAGVTRPFDYCKQLALHLGLVQKSCFLEGPAQKYMRLFAQIESKFDFILLDGNHDKLNVFREVELAVPILKKGGYLILDDIDYWDGPKSVYLKDIEGFEKIPLDARAGLLKKLI